MALRFIDGFDHYNTTADVVLKWTSQGGVAFGSTSTRFSSGNWMQMTTGSATVSKTIDAQATWIVGFAVKVSQNAGLGALVQFSDTGTGQVRLVLNADGTLSFQRGTTTLATSSVTMTTGVWYFVEVKSTINSTTGTYEVRMNGATIIGPATGANTRSSANNSANQIVLSSNINNSNGPLFDDVYVCDGTGSTQNDFLGDCRVQTLYPNGAGNYTQWTPLSGANNTNVDETPENGDTDYVSTATIANKDSYAFGNLVGPCIVKGVQVNLVARKDDAGTRQVQPLVRISSSDFLGTTVTLGASYLFFNQQYGVSPATSTAWTQSEVDGAEFGVNLVA